MFHDVQTARSPQRLQLAVQQVQHMQLAYLRTRDFDGAAALDHRLADLLDDEAFRLPPSEFERLYEEMLRQPPRDPESES